MVTQLLPSVFALNAGLIRASTDKRRASYKAATDLQVSGLADQFEMILKARDSKSGDPAAGTSESLEVPIQMSRAPVTSHDDLIKSINRQYGRDMVLAPAESRTTVVVTKPLAPSAAHSQACGSAEADHDATGILLSPIFHGFL